MKHFQRKLYDRHYRIVDTYNYLSASVKEAPVAYELVSAVWLQLSNSSYNSWCKCFCCIYFACVLRSPPLLDVNNLSLLSKPVHALSNLFMKRI